MLQPLASVSRLLAQVSILIPQHQIGWSSLSCLAASICGRLEMAAAIFRLHSVPKLSTTLISCRAPLGRQDTFSRFFPMDVRLSEPACSARDSVIPLQPVL